MKNDNTVTLFSPISLLRRSKTLLRNYLLFITILFVILCATTVFIYYYLKQTIQQEVIRTNESMARNVAQSMDDLMEQTQHITESLAANERVRFYFKTNRYGRRMDDYIERIMEQINAYVTDFDYIHSVYVYSPQNGTVIMPSGEYPVDSITDSGWLTALPGLTEGISFLSGKVKDAGPYVLSIINHVQLMEEDGYVILNMDLHKLPNILESDMVSGSYIVTDEKTVLYHKQQEQIRETLSDFPELADYQPSETGFSHLSGGSLPRIYTQKPSAHCPWSYATVTYLNEYTARLNRLRTILLLVLVGLFLLSVALALVQSIHSYKPILKLVNLLNDPEKWNDSQEMDEKDVNEIVQKIMVYAQANTQLSKELQSRLSVLSRTQLIALQSQINPHFMVNTLNLIHCAIVQDLGYKHLAAKMTVHLGRLLGYALDPVSLVSLKEEFYFAEIYLQILQERYRHKIETELTLAPDTAKVKIPKLILQPLIENCIYHGVGEELNPGFYIKVKSEHIPARSDPLSGKVCIYVEDNGKGMSQKKVAELNHTLRQDSLLFGGHIGLKNVAARMKLLFGEDWEMQVSSELGSGTTIRLSFFSLS